MLVEELGKGLEGAQDANAGYGGDLNGSSCGDEQGVAFAHFAGLGLEDSRSICLILLYEHARDVRFGGIAGWFEVGIAWVEFPRHEIILYQPILCALNGRFDDGI